MNTRNKRIIHTDILRENMRVIRAEIPSKTKVMAVVKADAYGHGLVKTAFAALEGGADMLAVATAAEGALLRKGGVESQILVLGAVNEAEVRTGLKYDLVQTVCSPEMVYLCREAAKAEGKSAAVHLKIDTGMGRIGVRNKEERDAVLQALSACPEVTLEGAFTHFADADGENEDYTRKQFELFLEMTQDLQPGLLLHCANSAAIHRFPEMRMSMVRAGISLYGYPPVNTSLEVKPAMEWMAEIIYVKELKAGETVSYGRIFKADKDMKVATIACGYGDGYHRAATGKAQVLIHGKRVPVIGRICMDQMMADVTDITGVQPGDEAILMGSTGTETINAEDLAQAAGTISYEILLAATERVEREWKA